MDLCSKYEQKRCLGVLNLGRRIMALILVLALAAAVLPTVYAQSPDKEAQICNQIRSDYQSALEASGKESLGGFCGLMTSWQLYFMGINKYMIPADGNKQYDTYCKMHTTSGGYAVKAYSAESYTLEQVLNLITRNGTRDVYNVLVGFETTTTEAGAQYGHAVVVYAIMDGMVYFTEGFQTSFGTGAGDVIKISIQQFAEYYADWMEFEGVIVFEKKTYADQCTVYPSNLFAKASVPAALLSEPYPVNGKKVNSKLCRTAAVGERLWVTGLYRNTLGQYYYQVDDSGEVCYAAAEELDFLQFNSEEDVMFLPCYTRQSTPWHPTGTILSDHAAMRGLRVEVMDVHGIPIGSYALVQKTDIYHLDCEEVQKLMWNCPVDKTSGCSIFVDLFNCYMQDGKLCSDTQTVRVQEDQMSELRSKAAGSQEGPRYEDGWTYDKGRWYYYEDGQPGTGWLREQNILYYLDETGAAVTGWQKIDGQKRFFSDTGVMRSR